jgi:hypothetical protein
LLFKKAVPEDGLFDALYLLYSCQFEIVRAGRHPLYIPVSRDRLRDFAVAGEFCSYLFLGYTPFFRRCRIKRNIRGIEKKAD